MKKENYDDLDLHEKPNSTTTAILKENPIGKISLQRLRMIWKKGLKILRGRSNCKLLTMNREITVGLIVQYGVLEAK